MAVKHKVLDREGKVATTKVWIFQISESMALYVMDKINKKIKFLYRKSQFLTTSLRRLLCNALIQPHFDYACSAWYPNLNKGLKKKLQITQNKCMRFCLQLGNR